MSSFSKAVPGLRSFPLRSRVTKLFQLLCEPKTRENPSDTMHIISSCPTHISTVTGKASAIGAFHVSPAWAPPFAGAGVFHGSVMCSKESTPSNVASCLVGQRDAIRALPSRLAPQHAPSFPAAHRLKIISGCRAARPLAVGRTAPCNQNAPRRVALGPCTANTNHKQRVVQWGQ